MASNETLKVVMNNVQFYLANVKILLKLRPDYTINFKPSNKHVSYTISGLKDNSIEGFEVAMELLPALNSSIILNCFALFEASFESRLLHVLDTSNLSGIQEQVMNRYIDDVIRLSSEEKYAREFKFITGKPLNSFFSAKENEHYKIIKTFYLLRNLLIHGSVTKGIMIPIGKGSKIEMDLDDTEYQKLIILVNEKLNIGVPPNLFEMKLLLINNKVADILVEAVLIVSNKLLNNTKTILKIFKSDNSKSI